MLYETREELHLTTVTNQLPGSISDGSNPSLPEAVDHDIESL